MNRNNISLVTCQIPRIRRKTHTFVAFAVTGPVVQVPSFAASQETNWDPEKRTFFLNEIECAERTGHAARKKAGGRVTPRGGRATRSRSERKRAEVVAQ